MRDGVDVVPAYLPIRISHDELKMTVADWIALKETSMSKPSMPNLSEGVTVLDGQLPLPPYADAGPTALDPDQDGLPQEPGSAVEDDDEEAAGGEKA
ncbi:hypothetical protein [Nonomuraea sp. NPDC049480]|uniref:hypothetical protein n=1 Tax=Nonomuraea sp. NPDC049480 TaxID=3364353 RepID=UPI0037BB4102